jgi:hypothetical protein
MADSSTSLARKLQVQPDQAVRVINAPPSFEFDAETTDAPDARAVLLFARNAAELDQLGEPMLDAARQDRLAWLCYPKAGQLDTDLNRDILWERMKLKGVRPVRQVSIDAVWSALRFRPA